MPPSSISRFSLYIRKHFGCDGEKLKISFCTDNWWANCPLRIRKSYSALHYLKSEVVPLRVMALEVGVSAILIRRSFR